MLYIFIGQSCTGKSTVAEKIKERIDIEVYSGKDYLRLAKSESEAWKIFHEKLLSVSLSEELSDKSVIYLVSDIEFLKKIQDIKDSRFVKFNASLDIIKSRFAQRINGKLSPPIEKMLEKQYCDWKDIVGNINVDTTVCSEIEEIVKLIV